MIKFLRGDKKPRASRVLAVSVLAVFLLVSLPQKAQAGCCVTSTVTDPILTSLFGTEFAAELADLGNIFGVVGNIMGAISTVMKTILPQGTGGTTAAVNAQSNVQGALIGDLADHNAGSNQYIMGQGLAAQHQANATMPMNASSCAMQQWQRGMQQMTDGLNGLKEALMRDVYGVECKGTGASCNGPARAWEKTQDACALGFISTVANGDLAAKLGCAGPPSGDAGYVDRDMHLAPFLDTLQMPIATPCVLGDGYLSFSGTAPTGGCAAGAAVTPTYNADPTQSQYAWVAALKLCEGLRSQPQPTVFIAGRQPSSADISAFWDSRTAGTAGNSNMEACIDALIKRTAVPTVSNTAAQAYTGASATTDLATFQDNLCKYMHDEPNPGGTADIPGMQGGTPTFPTNTGLGITGDPYLNNCVNSHTGISYWMAKKILADRCMDSNWLTNVMPTLVHDTHEGEMTVQKNCHEEQHQFEVELAAEKAAVRQFAYDAAQAIQTTGAQAYIPSSSIGRGMGATGK